MAPAPRTPPPDEPASDAELEDEQSSIRERVRRPATLPPASLETPERRLRIGRVDLKVRIAEVLLEDLPPGEPKARLLRVAIVRRDETLIDAIIAELATRFGR